MAFANETNTGAVGPLKASGSLTLSTPGQVVSGLNISGGVDITASNVTLENCVIHVTAANANWVVSVAAGLTGVTLKNCEIVGPGLSATTQDAGIYIKGDSQVTIDACNIHDVGHGIDVSGGPVVIQNSYIHDLNAADSSHYDAVYFGGDNNPNFSMLIQNNTFVNTNSQTSAIFMENYFGGVNNVTIDNNLLVGGGYTVYLVSNADVIEDGSGGKVSNVSFTNNHFGMGKYGYTYFSGSYNPVYTGNVNDGAALAASLPTGPNTTPPSTQPTLDVPVITSGDHVTHDNTVTLTGTAAAGSTVTVLDGTTKLGTVTVGSNGAWSYTTAALADGKHSLTATDTSSGKTSAASSAATITVDTHAPAVPVLVSDSVVNTNHVLLSGTAEANSTITVYDGTTAVGTATAGANGAWSVTTSALPSGSQVLTATATDAAGNTSAHSAGLDPVIGSPTPPSTPNAPVITSGNHVTNDNTVTVTGTAVAGSTVTVLDGTTKLGTATVNSSGAWSYTTAALTDGKHSLTATDTSSGKTSAASSAATITVDTHGPAAPVLVSDSVVNTNHVLLSGTAEASSTITVYDGNTAVGTATAGTNGAWSVTTSALATGSRVLTATATDVAGNTSAHSQALDPVIGSSAPPSAPTIVSYSQDSGVVGDHITNDNTLTLIGTAAANSTVKVFDGSTLVGTTTANSSGSWSDILAVLTDAKHTLTAIATNSSGKSSAASSALAVTIDTHGPAAPVLVSDSVVNTNHVLLSGTAEASSTITVYDGNTAVGTATAGTNGAWSVTTSALATGSRVLTATATDVAGNTSAHSQALDPVIGSSAPLSAPKIVSYSQDSGVVGDHITHDNTLTLTGTAVANSTVTVFDGTAKLGTATTNGSGAWTFATATLTDGKHSFTATDTSSGKTSAASSATAITIDTHGPAAPVLVSDSVVNTNHVLLSGTAEANSAITVYDGNTAVGTATAGTNGAWSVTTSALAAGSQVLTATATDAAGNTSAHSQALDPVIGSSAPLSAPKIVSYSQDSGVVGDHITHDNTLTLTGTAVANSTVTIFDGTSKLGTATVNGSGAWDYTTAALSDGGHNLTATDTSSGHTSTASSALGVTIDTHAPVAPTMGVYSEGGTAFSGATSVDDFLLKGTAEANSTVNVFDGGKQVGTAATNGSGLWSFDTGHLADGSHSFTSTAIDAAGNTSAASAAKGVMVDADPAAVGITNVSESCGDIVTIKGTADAFSQIKVFDGTKSVGMVNTGADGTWSYTSSSAVSNTVHTYSAQELDHTGHVVASSGNAILGSSGSNTLSSTGANNLFVGNGHPDTFVFASNFGNDVIKDFGTQGRGHDVIQFSKSVFDSFADVLAHATQSGQNVVIADTTGDSLTLKNVKLAALDKHDFHFA